jgi:predicted MFS family arabinose efflux permease
MASVSSLTSMGNYVSIAVSTYIAGLLMSWGAYLLPYAATCVFYLAAAVLYLKFFKHHEKNLEKHTQPAS